MTPDQAAQEADSGKLRPVYLITADEPYLASEVLARLRRAALLGAVAGLNDDSFSAAEHGVEQVLSAARTLPMMSKRRLVTVQRLEEWEPKATASPATPSSKTPDAFDRLLQYAKDPATTSTLLMSGRGLDKRRKLLSTARSQGWLVSCDPLERRELPGFVSRTAERFGGRLEAGIADLISELVGPELGAVADAVDRLCLYASGQPITEAMVAENIVRIRTQSVWELVGAVGRRDLGAALSALDDVFDPGEGVRLVGLLAWSTRQLIRFESALEKGSSPTQAAQQAGAPPFKAGELSQQIKRLPRGSLPDWLVVLAEMDLALKGGSKLPAKTILERGVVRLCGTPAPRPRPA